MRVLSLTRYDRLGASSRLRSIQYHPHLRRAGISVEHAPLFNDAYVLGLQQGRRLVADVLFSYIRRIQQLITRRDFDLLWIEKELLPWLPGWVERTLTGSRLPYVLDYDDAVFHYYDEHSSRLVRALLGHKHRDLMRGAFAVVAGNDYLADYAVRAGAQRVEIIPTVVDLDRYPDTPMLEARGLPPAIVWIGQRSTARYLGRLAPVFKRLTDAGQARLIAIGVDATALGLPMDSVPWSEATEPDMLSQCDIGIMPLPDDAFARGKCGYKLVQYMASHLPVVASPVGVNTTLVSHGVNGFLALHDQAWADALQCLVIDADLRATMGQAGRKRVEEAYCLQVTIPKLVDIFRRI